MGTVSKGGINILAVLRIFAVIYITCKQTTGLAYKQNIFLLENAYITHLLFSKLISSTNTDSILYSLFMADSRKQIKNPKTACYHIRSYSAGNIFTNVKNFLFIVIYY